MRKMIRLFAAVFIVAGLITACDEIDEVMQDSDAAEESALGIDTEDMDTEEADSTEESYEEDKDDADSEAELIGFTVYDRFQNKVRLSEYVTGNRVTMLNFWGTFCGPCIREMPDLAEIEKEYRDEGFEIVGVTTDATDYESGGLIPYILKDADSIIEQTGVEYPICFAGADLIQYTQITAVPTTFFVNENGDLLTDPMVGSRSREEWESIINELLEYADGE